MGVVGARSAPAVRSRLAASLGDLAVIVGGIGVLTVAGALVRPLLGEPAQPPSLPATDLLVLAATVLPAGVYLAAGEAGSHQAAWGKRRAALQVVTSDGGRPGVGRIALRTAVKLLPWQLAHLAVARLILQADDPVVTWGSNALAYLIPAVSVTMALRDPEGRALHDRVAGTRVVARS
jgi:uncharacterized RDD family membrane protein YckC